MVESRSIIFRYSPVVVLSLRTECLHYLVIFLSRRLEK